MKSAPGLRLSRFLEHELDPARLRRPEAEMGLPRRDHLGADGQAAAWRASAHVEEIAERGAFGRGGPAVGRGRFPAGNRVDGIAESLDGIAKSVDGIAATVDGIGKSVDGIPRSVDGIGKSVDGIGKSVDGFTKSVDLFGNPVDDIGKGSTVLPIGSTLLGKAPTFLALPRTLSPLGNPVRGCRLQPELAQGLAGGAACALDEASSSSLPFFSMTSQTRKLVFFTFLLIPHLLCAEVSPHLAEHFTYSPMPEYPDLARITHTEGKGLFEGFVDQETGKVTKVIVVQSIGDRLLDEEILGTLRRWRAKPHDLTTFKVPVTFKMSGWVEKELRAARVHAIYSPAPERPFSLWYERIHSGGYYQMTIDPKSGLVTDVKILNSSRVLNFDQSCLRTFRTWRYEPHTVTTEKVWVSF